MTAAAPTTSTTKTVWRRVAAVRTSDGAQLHASIDGPDDGRWVQVPLTLWL